MTPFAAVYLICLFIIVAVIAYTLGKIDGRRETRRKAVVSRETQRRNPPNMGDPGGRPTPREQIDLDEAEMARRERRSRGPGPVSPFRCDSY